MICEIKTALTKTAKARPVVTELAWLFSNVLQVLRLSYYDMRAGKDEKYTLVLRKTGKGYRSSH
jgi:hypothetical protein